MSPFRIVFALIIAVSAQQLPAQEQTTVQPFAGSELVSQQAADFDRLTYLTRIDKEGASETAAIEGKLVKGLYRWPGGKAPLEIRRSFESALESGGFAILANAETPQFSPQARAVQDVQGLNKVDFGIAGQQVTVFPGHYLSARRTKDGEEVVFTLTMSSQNPVYMTEEARVAVMAEGMSRSLPRA